MTDVAINKIQTSRHGWEITLELVERGRPRQLTGGSPYQL